MDRSDILCSARTAKILLRSCLHVGISQLLQSDYLHYLRLAL